MVVSCEQLDKGIAAALGAFQGTEHIVWHDLEFQKP